MASATRRGSKFIATSELNKFIAAHGSHSNRELVRTAAELPAAADVIEWMVAGGAEAGIRHPQQTPAECSACGTRGAALGQAAVPGSEHCLLTASREKPGVAT